MTFSSNSLNEILRPNARIHFLGFVANGHQLQSAGWEISADQHFDHSRGSGISVRLALQNKQANLQMITQPMTWGFENLNKFHSELEFEICAVASSIHFHVMPMREIGSWSALDMTPALFEPMKSERKKLSDIVPFQTLNNSVDMYLEEKAVSELLELIKKKQVPVQDAIRKRNELRGWRAKNLDDFGKYNPQHEIKAQLVAI